MADLSDVIARISASDPVGALPECVLDAIVRISGADIELPSPSPPPPSLLLPPPASVEDRRLALIARVSAADAHRSPIMSSDPFVLTPPPAITLNKGQQDAVARVIAWRFDSRPDASRFMSLTGAAGTGKSTLMAAVRDRLSSRCNREAPARDLHRTKNVKRGGRRRDVDSDARCPDG